MGDPAIVRRFLQEKFLFGEEGVIIDDNASLVESGIVDSTGILELVAFVEETFEVSIRDEDIVPENFDSIARIMRFVDQGSRNSADNIC